MSALLALENIQFAALPIVGLSAVSEDFSVTAPIVTRQEGIFSLGSNAIPSSFTDADGDGDGRRIVYLSDLSVGAEVVLPAIAEDP